MIDIPPNDNLALSTASNGEFINNANMYWPRNSELHALVTPAAVDE